MVRRCACVLVGFFLCLLIALSGYTQPLDDSGIGSIQMGQSRGRSGPGVISQTKWSDDGKFLEYVCEGKQYRFDLSKKELLVVGDAEAPEERPRMMRERVVKMGSREIPFPARGHQFMTEMSPDGKWFSVCKDWNVVLENDETGETVQVTTDGHRKFRYGTANWTYGEEIGVRHGMWWTLNSKKLIYYVFDERPVQDFYLIGDLTEVNTALLTEGYIKAGAPNPVVWLEIYDLEMKKRTPIDLGQKEQDQYIFDMRFALDGKEFLFNRIDRHHHHLEVMALDYQTGKLRVVVEETQETWQDNSPPMRFLEDGKRFIWPTEKTMWQQYELRNLDGKLVCTLTKGVYPATSIVEVDEKNGWLYYRAYSDGHPLCEQLHKVRLNGKGQKRLTPLEMNYTRVDVSPDGKWFTAQYENVKTPPSTALFTTDGKLVKVLTEGPKPEKNLSELFTFKANDGKSDIYGVLHKPEDFDPNKKYPLIVSVYGGPASRAVSNRYTNGHPYTKEGYLVAQIDNRGTSGRGKAFMATVYKRLGDIDIQDQADGVRHLRQRPYVDGRRVGIVGHSYGGFMAAMGIVKHPDVFAAAVDRAGPTDWRNYDSIYTERYMSLPQDNPEGYDNGSAMKFVEQMTGKLLIMHGMVDDNVHPTNAWQFIDALDKAKKTYESRFFPKGTHGFDGTDTQWEFFRRHLIEPYEKEQ
ncbi:MAG: DPP IV N-terminal domain-containing protein [bacterium]